MSVVPERPTSVEAIAAGDSLSPVTPFRIINIANSEPVHLLEFLDAIESAL